ncbi:methyl-accepting chemotaxis protein [Gammaproteobacteria bacterium AS21]
MLVLKRFSIVQLSLVSFSLFVLLTICLMTLNVRQSLAELELEDNDKHVVFLLDALEKIAHNTAVERGLTAGFLASPSDDKKAKVDAQRTIADGAVEHLKELAQSEWPPHMRVLSRLSLLNKYLDKRALIRESVDKLDAQGAFTLYSTINEIALSSMSNFMLDVSRSELKQNLKAAVLLAQYKEQTGKIRGKANGVLTRGAITNAEHSEISSYLVLQTHVVESIESFLLPEAAHEFTNIMSEPRTGQLANVTTALLSKPTDFSNLPTAQAWFSLMSAQINDVKLLLDNQWLAITAQSNLNITRSTNHIVYTALIAITFLILVIFINIYLVRSLRMQLDDLSVNLNNIADNNDLTTDVTLSTNNELGRISVSINTMIVAIKSLILGLDSTIKTSSKFNENLGLTTSAIVKGSQETQELASSISHAIEALVDTSDEIAQSAVLAKTSSNSLETTASDSLKLNQQTKDAADLVDANMKAVQQSAGRMETQVVEISTILDTINSLSDQTNLLALNAAIEAARAGEHGRGFAVVADEVRVLAQGSRDASDKIHSLLSDLQQVSSQVVEGINQNVTATADLFEYSLSAEKTSNDVKTLALELEHMATSLSAAAEEQTTTLGQVAGEISHIQKVALHEFELSKNLQSIYQDSNINNKELQQSIDTFIIER